MPQLASNAHSLDEPPAPDPLALRVLVVDDEPSFRATSCRMLRLRGFSPAEAATVENAVSIARTTPLGAVVLDLDLRSNESGLGFLAWLRDQPRYAEIPVLIVTGKVHLAKQEANDIRRLGAHVFYKPLPLSTVADYLTRFTN